MRIPTLLFTLATGLSAAPIGIFENASDVGKIDLKGPSGFLAEKDQYRSAGGKPKIIATLFGGQGSFNVPSWSPDSKKLAFVSYRHAQP